MGAQLVKKMSQKESKTQTYFYFSISDDLRK